MSMNILRKLNLFTLIVPIIAMVSIVQIGSLQKELMAYINPDNWEQYYARVYQSSICITSCSLPEESTQIINTTFKPERLVAPSVQLEKEIVSVPLHNGTWEVKDDVANYAEGTSLVNSKGGNVGIYGHAKVNAFLPIKNIKVGESIELYGAGYKATYKVVKTDIISPNAVEVFYPTQKPSVTLITCDGAHDTYRYMVRAELVSLKK